MLLSKQSRAIVAFMTIRKKTFTINCAYILHSLYMSPFNAYECHTLMHDVHVICNCEIAQSVQYQILNVLHTQFYSSQSSCCYRAIVIPYNATSRRAGDEGPLRGHCNLFVGSHTGKRRITIAILLSRVWADMQVLLSKFVMSLNWDEEIIFYTWHYHTHFYLTHVLLCYDRYCICGSYVSWPHSSGPLTSKHHTQKMN